MISRQGALVCQTSPKSTARFPDGRPLGEAVAEDAAEDPRRIREPWHVCTEAGFQVTLHCTPARSQHAP